MRSTGILPEHEHPAEKPTLRQYIRGAGAAALLYVLLEYLV